MMKSLIRFVFALFALLFVANILGGAVGAALLPTFGLLVVISILASMVPGVSGSLNVDALVTLFAKDITKNLYPDNAFYKRSKNDTAFLSGKTVVLPQTGAKPNVEKNRTTLPATISKRVDDQTQYDIDEFTTDPILIQDTEEIVISYPKRQSILEDHTSSLNERIADTLANIWLPTLGSNIVRTTGGATAATAPGATGDRKLVTKEDFIGMFNLFNRMDLPMTGRFAVLPADMYADILKIDGFVEADKIGSSNLISGIVGRLLNFDIYIRSKVGVYDNSATPVKKAIGAAGEATDNLASLFWHESFVRRAEGSVKVFSDIDKSEYYGSVFSALVRAGGSLSRADQKGVAALVQSATI
jgi:hypothetical protein